MKNNKTFEEQIANYVRELGGNDVDVELILEDVEESGFTTMEEVKKHIDNYYL